MSNRRVLLLAAAVMGSALAAGCASESTTVQANPAWSATVPEYGVKYSRTTNVFPFYSKNVTAYSDRIEETGNALLFISWSKATLLSEPEGREAPAAPAQPLEGEQATDAGGEALEVEVSQ